MDGNASGPSDNYGTHETVVVARNSFNYPATHGEVIPKTGYSFISCGLTPCSSPRKKNERDSIANQMDAASGDTPVLRASDYKYVDLVLGKQRQSKIGREGIKPLGFKTSSEEMQNAISNYCRTGGDFFVSGAYIASDL